MYAIRRYYELFYLPEAHTDFVFAVYAEEFGLLGSLVLIALFLALLWRVFKLAMRAANSESRLRRWPRGRSRLTPSQSTGIAGSDLGLARLPGGFL